MTRKNKGNAEFVEKPKKQLTYVSVLNRHDPMKQIEKKKLEQLPSPIELPPLLESIKCPKHFIVPMLEPDIGDYGKLTPFYPNIFFTANRIQLSAESSIPVPNKNEKTKM